MVDDQEAAALVEPRIIVRAAKCGHHFDEGCNACASAEKWTNAQLDELRAQLAESQSEREEQARLLGMSGSREARLRAQLAQAEAGKAEMMKALEPFAKCCEDWIAGYEDDEDGAKFRLLIKDYRRAFATLAKHRKAS